MDGNLMDTAPKDRPILAWCDHEADPFTEGKTADGRTILTLYAAHGEGLSYAPTGFHIVEWGGAFCDSPDDGGANLPDWWFVAGAEFEVVANPVRWWPLPAELPRTTPWCDDCGVNRADPPSNLCPGCQAYREHTRAI